MWLNDPREEIPAWSNRLLYYAARLNLPWMAACIYLACNVKLKEAVGGRPAKRVLINYTQGPFIQDIEAIFADRADVEVQASPTRTLRTVACAFLSNKLDHNCYLSDDAEVAASKERYPGLPDPDVAGRAVHQAVRRGAGLQLRVLSGAGVRRRP